MRGEARARKTLGGRCQILSVAVNSLTQGDLFLVSARTVSCHLTPKLQRGRTEGHACLVRAELQSLHKLLQVLTSHDLSASLHTSRAPDSLALPVCCRAQHRRSAMLSVLVVILCFVPQRQTPQLEVLHGWPQRMSGGLLQDWSAQRDRLAPPLQGCLAVTPPAHRSPVHQCLSDLG